MNIKYILALSFILAGCSNCKSGNLVKPTPTPTVAIPDAGSIIEASTPEKKKIVFVSLEDAVNDRKEDTCLFIYFNEQTSNDLDIILENDKFIDIVNNHFVSVSFPITTDNRSDVMKDFQLTTIPTLMFVPPYEGQVLEARGEIPVKELLVTLEKHLQTDLFASCDEIK